MKCTHSYTHYKQSLIRARELNYHFLKLNQFKEIDDYLKVIFLRHDIDFSMDNALQMARIENDLDIKSTYFVRTSGKYNIMYYSNYIKLKEIINLGHEIGLHYSIDIPILLDEKKEVSFAREKKILEMILGLNIKGICLHDPNSHNRLNVELSKYNLLYDAYSDFFFTRLKYISDSRGSWRDGCMCKNIGKHDKLYILTHPFWWFNKSSCENY